MQKAAEAESLTAFQAVAERFNLAQIAQLPFERRLLRRNHHCPKLLLGDAADGALDREKLPDQ
ncbi:MAG: hypothetical protein WBD46_10575 [Acidobacteriaceae bacterium]